MQHGISLTLTGTSVVFTLKDIVARRIAYFLEKSPSTISREIQKHSLVKIPNSCDCNDSNGCNVRHVCESKDCNKKCRSYHLAHNTFQSKRNTKNRCIYILNIKTITIDKNYIFDIIRLINKERHRVMGGKMINK